MNVIRLEGETLWTKTGEVDRFELGKLADAEIKGGFELYTSTGLKYHLTPETFESEAEVLNSWNKLYPNGKPKPEPQPQEPTIEDYMVDLDYRLSKIEMGV